MLNDQLELERSNNYIRQKKQNVRRSLWKAVNKTIGEPARKVLPLDERVKLAINGGYGEKKYAMIVAGLITPDGFVTEDGIQEANIEWQEDKECIFRKGVVIKEFDIYGRSKRKRYLKSGLPLRSYG